MSRKSCTFVCTLITIVTSLVAYTWAQAPAGGFEQFWGPNYTYPTVTAARRPGPPPDPSARDAMHHWNHIAIDSSGLDHTPVLEGDPRIFGEQLGPGRSSRAMAIVHIAMFDAVNAIAKRYRSYTGIPDAAPGASMDAAIAQAAHDTLVAMYPVAEGPLRRAARRGAGENCRRPRQDRGHPRRAAGGARDPGAPGE